MKGGTFAIHCPAFGDGEKIPNIYACDGNNINPELEFRSVPEGTKSLALIVDDPDAPSGLFIHWVIWNIPPETRVIKEAASPFGVSGLNGADETGYVGPCPGGGVHRYFFKVFALDNVISLSPQSYAVDLMRAMNGHIIGQAQLIGLYERSIK